MSAIPGTPELAYRAPKPRHPVVLFLVQQPLGAAGLAIIVLMILAGVLTFVLQTKLPHRKMLIVTGIMIAAVLVTMVGHTVHVLQVVGWLPIWIATEEASPAPSATLLLAMPPASTPMMGSV